MLVKIFKFFFTKIKNFYVYTVEPGFEEWWFEVKYAFFFTRRQLLNIFFYIKNSLKLNTRWLWIVYLDARYEARLCKMVWDKISTLVKKAKKKKKKIRKKVYLVKYKPSKQAYLAKRWTYYYYFRSFYWFLCIAMVISLIVCVPFVVYLFCQWPYL